MKCEDCRYWASPGIDTEGSCLRYPKQPIYKAVEKPRAALQETLSCWWGYPPVYGYEYCGEFKEKEETEKAPAN